MATPYTTISFGLVLAGLALIIQAANGDVYHVASNVGDCKNVDAIDASCNTLDHYANSTHLRITDSVFYFMPGRHILHRTWKIIKASNITLTSQLPGSELSGDVVVERPGSSCKPNITDVCVALSFITIYRMQLSNLVFSGSEGFQLLCLRLISARGYSITNSVFSQCRVAIEIDGCRNGKIESTSFLDCYTVVMADMLWPDNEKASSLQMHEIYSSGSTEGAFFRFCSGHLSLTNSYFIDSGPIAFYPPQLCSGEYPHRCTRP